MPTLLSLKESIGLKKKKKSDQVASALVILSLGTSLGFFHFDYSASAIIQLWLKNK